MFAPDLAPMPSDCKAPACYPFRHRAPSITLWLRLPPRANSWLRELEIRSTWKFIWTLNTTYNRSKAHTASVNKRVVSVYVENLRDG